MRAFSCQNGENTANILDLLGTLLFQDVAMALPGLDQFLENNRV